MAVDREGPIQKSIVAYLKQVMPDAVVHACANESHLRGEAAMLATVRKKAQGQVTGFPDLLVLPYATATAPVMFFEVKAPKGSASPAQREVHARIRRLGHKVAIVRSIDDVRDHLILWGVGFAEKIPLRGTIS